MPQFESEAKRATSSIKVTKTTAAPTIEGTSVMPRQRPKGNPSQPLSTVLPISISASPTNIPKKSQSPITSTETNAFPTNFQAFPPIPSPSYQAPPAVSAAVALPPPQPQTTAQTTTAAAAAALTNQAFTPNFFPPNSSSSQELPDNHNINKTLENLFQSTVYPDPFRDDASMGKPSPTASTAPPIPAVGTPSSGKAPELPESQVLNVASSITPMQIPEACMLAEVTHVPAMSYIQEGGGKVRPDSSSQCMVGSDSPPSSPTLNVPKGHRRNMSDTSAFNK